MAQIVAVPDDGVGGNGLAEHDDQDGSDKRCRIAHDDHWIDEHPDRIVLHIAGADRPGVTARLAEVIAEENADLVDIGQSVLHGYLMLSAIVDPWAAKPAIGRVSAASINPPLASASN